MNKIIYKTFRFIFLIIFYIFWPIEVRGDIFLYDQGPMIFAANHVSYLDPLVLAIAIKRPIYFIAKKELFKNYFMGFLAKAVGAIPVDRKSLNPGTIKKSLQILKEGNILGIFPEGTRSIDGQLMPFNDGFIRIALKSGAPVVPVGITGTFDVFPPKAKLPALFNRKKIIIVFGKPFSFDMSLRKSIEYQQLSINKVQKKIKEILKNYS